MSYTQALVGGCLIGSAAVIFMLTAGRIAGISGHLRNALFAPRTQRLSVAFIVSLGVAGALTAQLVNGALPSGPSTHPALLILAGLLVGFGTRLGSGCTSGHGVCGMARLSVRSVCATLTFVGTGMLIATLVHRLT
ncbi:MAG: YeeE/YedE thiosulfate transporter family protein [Pseudomonadota bacterium]